MWRNTHTALYVCNFRRLAGNTSRLLVQHHIPPYLSWNQTGDAAIHTILTPNLRGRRLCSYLRMFEDVCTNQISVLCFLMIHVPLLLHNLAACQRFLHPHTSLISMQSEYAVESSGKKIKVVLIWSGYLTGIKTCFARETWVGYSRERKQTWQTVDL